MPCLPHNIERLRDRGGYRYRGYSADGFCVRLHRDACSRLWHAYTLSGTYAGCGATLRDISNKLSHFYLRSIEP